MDCLMVFFPRLLLLINFIILAVTAVDINSIERDLAEFNITCYKDNCNLYDRDSLSSRPCQCGVQCVQLGTCCIDSYYADIPQRQLKPTCRSVYNNPLTYFILDQCSASSAWSSLCNDEWNGENDVLKLVPVTSLLTLITYKNFYCLRCHENTDEFIYWNVNIESNYAKPDVSANGSKQPYEHISFAYDTDMNSWMAIYNEDIGFFPVNLTVQTHPIIRQLVHYCEPGVISDCPDEWYDEDVRNKCQSYMSMKQVSGTNNSVKYYKNIHCALCNFESLNDISCKMIRATPFDGVMPLSFAHLLDVNPSDGELVGKTKKCPDDHIWDPFTSKCREVTCALPGHKLENGKCVQI